MNIIILILFIIGAVYSIILHEIAHGAVAEFFGDDTARLMGRITLNPIPHIDPIFTILVPGFLLYQQLVLHIPVPVFGAARPVPVNYSNLRNYRWGVFWVSIAGILTNLLIALVFSIPLHVPSLADPARTLFSGIVAVNVVLAVVNMIPIPPIDGSKVIAALIGERAIDAISSIERRGAVALLPLILIIIIFFQSSLFYAIVQPVLAFLYKLFGVA